MNKMQKGFTLIELMIVIAIIGILAAIAIPQYQDYVTRSKVVEGLNLSAAAKTAVSESYQTYGRFPISTNVGTANNSFGLPTDTSISGQYVLSVGVTAAGQTRGTDGAIKITYNTTTLPQLAGANVLYITPYTSAGSIAWACGNATITVAGTSVTPTNVTSVPAKYLPASCR